MRDCIELAHRGYGESCIIGVAASGQEIATRPFQLVTGRVWKGTAFGGWKSRTEVPQLVNKVLRGETSLDDYVSHKYEGLEKVNESIDALHKGDCIRAVVQISARPAPTSTLPLKVNVYESHRCHGGYVRRVRHWSESNQCEMAFSIYIPEPKKRGEAPPPVIYFLSGLTSTDENALIKSDYARYAVQHGVAFVFPDTSPRGTGIESPKGVWWFGEGAGFYLDATKDPWAKNNRMFTYINKELPQLVSNIFPVHPTLKSVTGFSMGGHGALVSFL